MLKKTVLLIEKFCLVRWYNSLVIELDDQNCVIAFLVTLFFFLFKIFYINMCSIEIATKRATG